MADNTPHGHWSAYGNEQEMAEWNCLHELLVSGLEPPMDHPCVRRLYDLARAYGYGEADTFIAQHGYDVGEEEGDAVKAQREMFEGFEASDYFRCIQQSCEVAAEAVRHRPNANGLAFAAELTANLQREGFKMGRQVRLDEDRAPQMALLH